MLLFMTYELAKPVFRGPARAAPDAHPRPGSPDPGVPPRAPDPAARARAAAKVEAISSELLPDGRMGLPLGTAGDRDSVLSRGPEARANREGDERPREPTRDHDVPPSRGRSRVQLRVSALS